MNGTQALMHHPVDRDGQQDWMVRWAERAPARICKHCLRDFQPNHPRRHACGRDDCSEVAAQRAGTPVPVVNGRARARETGVQGVFAEAMMVLNDPAGPVGTRDEIIAALRALSEDERGLQPTRRAAYAPLIAAIVARSLHADP